MWDGRPQAVTNSSGHCLHTRPERYGKAECRGGRLLIPAFPCLWCSTTWKGLTDSIMLGRYIHAIKVRHQTAASWFPWKTSQVTGKPSPFTLCLPLKCFWGAEKPSVPKPKISLYTYLVDAKLHLAPPGSTGFPNKPEKATCPGEEMRCVVLYSAFFSPQQILGVCIFHKWVQIYLQLLIPVLTFSW